MKRLLVLLLASLMLFAFVACDDNTPDPPAAEEPTPTPENPDKPNPDNPDPDVPEVCVHAKLIDTLITEYFDAGEHYPKSGVCAACGETVTRDAIAISTANELMQLAKDINSHYDIGCSDVSIINDIDMSENEWIPLIIGYTNESIKTLSIDGQEHIISNLNVTDEDGTMTGVGLIGEIWGFDVSVEVKNLTLESANFTDQTASQSGYIMVGGFAGYIDASSSIRFINCHLSKSRLNSGDYAGGIYGWSAGNADLQITIDGCSVDGCNMQAGGSVGGLVGHASSSTYVTLDILDSSVTGSTIKCTDDSTEKAGNIIGTVNVAKTTISNVDFNDNEVSSSTAENIDRYVGRLAFTEKGGSLTIDGKPVTGTAI